MTIQFNQHEPNQEPSNNQEAGKLLELQNEWAQYTNAQVLTPARFQIEKDARNLHVVGVIGFSGQWSEAKIDENPELRIQVLEATSQLRQKLIELREEHQDSLVISSGATMEGVPKIIYDLCDSLGIAAMGVACEKAKKYPLGKMDYFLPVGAEGAMNHQAFWQPAMKL